MFRARGNWPQNNKIKPQRMYLKWILC